MRKSLVLAGAVLLLASGPALAQVNTGDRNNRPVKLKIKPSGHGTGVQVRGAVLKTRSGANRTALASTGTGASVLGGRNAKSANLAAARTNTSVLRTRTGDHRSSLVNPKLKVKVLPATNGPVSVRSGHSSPLAATALTPPKAPGH